MADLLGENIETILNWYCDINFLELWDTDFSDKLNNYTFRYPP
jgi:hypothetical protein